MTDHLGSGHFGNVNKGLWQTASGSKPVAIKMLKSDPSDSDKVKFLQEAAVNGQFRHPNVVKLLGVVTIGEPVSCSVNCMHALEWLRHCYFTKLSVCAFEECIPSSCQFNKHPP